MSELFRSSVTDVRIAEAEDILRTTIAQSLSAVLQKEIEVASSGPCLFDFKEAKGIMPGEVVVCTATCTDGSAGRLRFAISKESAAVIADHALMGDGKAEFVPDQHLEPLRDLISDTIKSFATQLGQKVGRSLAFDDLKIVVMDLTPNDYSTERWIVSAYDLELDDPHRLIVISSAEFFESLFPRTEAQQANGAQDDSPSGASIDEEMYKEIGLVMDIELPISIELGRTNMLIRDIVNLTPGAVVELNKLSGEPVDLFVNNKRFARGEVVVVDENFAVRLTELENPEDRLAAARR